MAGTGTTPTPPAALEEGAHCTNCGYDLRGLPTGRCPECGFGFEPEVIAALAKDVIDAHDLRLDRAALGSLLAGAGGVLSLLCHWWTTLPCGWLFALTLVVAWPFRPESLPGRLTLNARSLSGLLGGLLVALLLVGAVFLPVITLVPACWALLVLVAGVPEEQRHVWGSIEPATRAVLDGQKRRAWIGWGFGTSLGAAAASVAAFN